MARRSEAEEAARRTLAGFVGAAPILLGVLGLVMAATAGALAAGNAMAGYVLAGELLAAGLSLATATAFLMAWVTVGVVQLPAEIAALGLRFAPWRNTVSFVLVIVAAYAVAAAVTALG